MGRLVANARALLNEPFLGSSRFYWLYLLTSVLIAAAIYGIGSGAQTRWSLRGFLAFCFPGHLYRHPSAIVDYKLLLANALLAPGNLILATFPPAVIASWTAGWLNRTCGPLASHLEFSGWRVLAYTAVTMVLREFAMYVYHVLAHKIPLLWEFHKVHHSAEVLTPITNERKHPLEILMIMGMVVLPLGLWQGLAIYALFESASVVSLFGVELFVALFFLTSAHLRHSHIWLSYGPALSRILISPAQHQIHHSTAPRHADKNFGEMLSVFDWLFGTLYVPRERENLTFGIQGMAAQEHNGLVRAYLIPFVNAARILRG